MRDALSRSIHFIAWGNFARPAVYVAWLESLALLGLVVWVALATASLFDSGETESSPTDALITSFATGVALWVPALFILACVHAYRAPVVAALAVMAVVAPGIQARSAVALARPGRAILAALRAEPWLWLLFVLCSMSALLPPYRWDETAYHLAQAEQWVQAGSLTVDPSLRYPLNACNWQLVQGVALMLRSESLVHLLTWLSGCLAALCVRAWLERLGVHRAVSYPAAIAFFVTPLVQNGLTTGLIDVPLMFWLTVAVYMLSRRGGALCAAMFVGMKITALLFLPLFIGLAVWHYRGRRLATYVAVLFIGSAPWYVRNLALSGDPVPPLLVHPARYWSDWDREAQAADLHKGLSWSPTALATLPWRTLSSTDEGSLRGWPLLGYILVFPFSILLLRRVSIVAAWYGVIVWIATSYHLRYAMFLPLAVIAAAYVLSTALSHARAWLAAAVSTLLLIGPTPAAAQYIKNDWSRPIPIGDPLADLGPCEAGVMRDITRRVPPPGLMYLVNLSPLKYALEVRGYRAVGDDFHEGRWTDFWRAVDARATGAFLHSLPVSYVAVCRSYPADRTGRWPETLATLSSDSALAPMTTDSVAALFRITP